MGDAIVTCNGRATINIKYYGPLFNIPGSTAQQRDTAYRVTQVQVLQEARRLALERGYAGIEVEGRSDGWLVPHYDDASYRSIYPDVQHNNAERERFRAFQRRVRKLLFRVAKMYEANLKDIVSESESHER